MKKGKPMLSHLNHLFSEIWPSTYLCYKKLIALPIFFTPLCCILEVHIWTVVLLIFFLLLMVFLICCQHSIFSSIDKNWDLQTILWLQFQTLFDPNVLHIGSSYSELLFCSFSFFPADGVSHMLSTLYLFKHWQKLGFATLNRPIILCLSEACQCLLNTMLDFVNFLSDFIVYS